jgi:hypothetical protein
MIPVQIEFDKKTMKRLQFVFKNAPKKMPRIMTRSINRTVTMARTESRRQIRETVNIKAGTINKAIKIDKAKGRNWRGALHITDRRLSLAEFGARQTKKRGVTYSIEKGKRKRIDSAFVRKLKTQKAVFRRAGKNRYPLIFLKGPSLGAVVNRAGKIVREVQAKALRYLSKNIDDQIKLLFR